MKRRAFIIGGVLIFLGLVIGLFIPSSVKAEFGEGTSCGTPFRHASGLTDTGEQACAIARGGAHDATWVLLGIGIAVVATGFVMEPEL